MAAGENAALQRGAVAAVALVLQHPHALFQSDAGGLIR